MVGSHSDQRIGCLGSLTGMLDAVAADDVEGYQDDRLHSLYERNNLIATSDVNKCWILLQKGGFIKYFKLSNKALAQMCRTKLC